MKQNDNVNHTDEEISDGSFELAHHASSSPVFLQYNKTGIYTVSATSGWDTVDMQRMAEAVQMLMGPAIATETLKSSGTLTGLMTATGMMGITPSLMEVTLCMAVMSIEMSISSPALQAGNLNRRTIFTRTTEDVNTKAIVIDDGVLSNYQFERVCLQAAFSTMLVALVLFDEALKLYDENDTSQTSIYNMLINALNIAHTINISSTSVPAYQTNSFSLAICSIMLNILSCDRSLAGLGGQGFYYQHYINSVDYKLHNTFFYRMFPAKYTQKHPINTGLSQFRILLGRFLFCSKYSNWDTYVTASAFQRELSTMKDSDIEFTRYMVETDILADETNQNYNLFKYVGFDTLDAMILNKQKPIKDQDKNYNTLYDKLLALAKNYKDLYNKVLTLPRKCPFQVNTTDTKSSSSFWTSTPELDKSITLNNWLFSRSKTDELLYILEKQESGDNLNWKVILINTMGNRIAIGMKIVGLWSYNYNQVTFDYYIKLMTNNQIMQAADSVATLIAQTSPDSYSYDVDLESLERVLKVEKTGLTSDQEDMDKATYTAISGAMDFAYNVGSYLEGWKTRADLYKDFY